MLTTRPDRKQAILQGTGNLPAPCHNRFVLDKRPAGVESAEYDPGMTELDLLLKAIAEDLGDPSVWSAPWSFVTHLRFAL